jgi:hypothetical protein
MGSTVTGKKTVGFTEECPNGAPGPQKRADRFRSIQNSAGSAFARCHAILHLKNVLKFSSSGLQFRDQQTKWVHNFLPFFADHQLLVGDPVRLPQLPNRSLNPGLRGGWYQPASSEFAGFGLISLALKPVPVEEQPVASIIVAASTASSDLIRFENSPKQ